MIASSIDAGMIWKRSHLTRVALEIIDRIIIAYRYPQSTPVNESRENRD